MWELAISEAREELVRVFTDRSMKLKELVEEVRKTQKNLRPDTFRFAWVKAHVGTQGDEKADQMAKSRAELGDETEVGKVITEGDLRQEWNRRRLAERKMKGTGMGQTVGRSGGMMVGAG